MKGKSILKMAPVLSTGGMYLRSFRSFQRGTASLFSLIGCKVVSYQSLRSEKNSAAWPVTHPVQLARDQKPADGIILIVWWTTTLQPFNPPRHTVPLWKDFKLLKHIPQFVKLVTFFKIGFPLSKWSYFKSAYILGVLPLFTRLYHTILLISIYCTMNRVVRAGWAEWARAHPLFCLNLIEKRHLHIHFLLSVE